MTETPFHPFSFVICVMGITKVSRLSDSTFWKAAQTPSIPISRHMLLISFQLVTTKSRFPAVYRNRSRLSQIFIISRQRTFSLVQSLARSFRHPSHTVNKIQYIYNGALEPNCDISTTQQLVTSSSVGWCRWVDQTARTGRIVSEFWGNNMPKAGPRQLPFCIILVVVSIKLGTSGGCHGYQSRSFPSKRVPRHLCRSKKVFWDKDFYLR
jgi:hypothetical protein